MLNVDMEQAVKDVQNLINIVMKNPNDHSVTAWHILEHCDGGNYAIAIGYSDGFDPNESDKYASDGERLCMKMAFCPDNSVMNEYSVDWVMPADPNTGEIYDTEVSVSESTDIKETVEWLCRQYEEFMKRKERNEDGK